MRSWNRATDWLRLRLARPCMLGVRFGVSALASVLRFVTWSHRRGWFWPHVGGAVTAVPTTTLSDDPRRRHVRRVSVERALVVERTA